LKHPVHLLINCRVFVLHEQAEALRLDCSCPHLKTRDPRSALTYLQQLVAEKDAAKKSDSTSSRTSSNVTVTAPRDPVPLPLTKS